MPNPSVSMDDELLEEFDEKIWEMKVEGKIDRNASRSQVIEELIRQWVEGNSSSSSTESPPTMTAD